MITANCLKIFVMSGTEVGGSTGVRSSIDLGRVFYCAFGVLTVYYVCASPEREKKILGQ